MAYFLGRDVKVAITTEDPTVGVGLDDSVTGDPIAALEISESTEATVDFAAADTLFAGPRDCNDSGTDSVFNEQTSGVSANPTYSNEVADLTGCDLSIGVTDEDISYFGLRQVLKAEIKKETTISLTRKKGNAVWDKVFNDNARWGIDEAGTALRSGIAGMPDDIGFGYRLYVKLKDTSEVFILRNACIQGHTISLNVDGTTEETMEFMTYVDPLIVGADAATMVAGTGTTEL